MVRRDREKRKGRAIIKKPSRPAAFSPFANIGARKKAEREAPAPFKAERRPDVQHTTLLPSGKRRIELGESQRVLTQGQFDELNRARKEGGRGIQDPQVRQAYLEGEQAKESQRLGSAGFEAEQTRLRMREEAAAAEEGPVRDIVTGELPVTEEAKPKGTVKDFLSAAWKGPLGALNDPHIPESAGRKLEAGMEALKTVSGVGTVARAFERIMSYDSWRDLEDAEMHGAAAVTEFNKIIDDVMIGATSELRARVRFNKAKEMLGSSISNTKQVQETNPVFFQKEGEEQMFHLREIEASLPEYANELNRVLSFPGMGRRQTTRETGLPEEEPLE